MRKPITAVYVGTLTTCCYLLTTNADPLPMSGFAVIFGTLPPLDLLAVLLTRAALVFGFVTVVVWFGLSLADA